MSELTQNTPKSNAPNTDPIHSPCQALIRHEQVQRAVTDQLSRVDAFINAAGVLAASENQDHSALIKRLWSVTAKITNETRIMLLNQKPLTNKGRSSQRIEAASVAAEILARLDSTSPQIPKKRRAPLFELVREGLEVQVVLENTAAG
ncbi:MAG: hypothetical protein HQL53_11320 [Magnetococcales bacterium]|nr:hypothetical protein [Magnetococcales bacterium]